jgi:ferredoxin
MKVRVDQELCTGCGLCVELCPDVYEMNDDGLAEAKIEDVPKDLASDARDAAEDCPVEAIVVEE